MPDFKARAFLEFFVKGSKSASGDLDDVDRKLKTIQKTGTAVGTTLRRYLGAAAIGALLRSSIIAFAGYERQLNAVASTLEQVGIDADEATPKVREFVKSLEAATGIEATDIIREFQLLVGLTGDVDAAFALVQTAAGRAEKGLGDFSNSARLLAGLLQGEVLEPAKSLGIALDKTRTSTEQAGEVVHIAADRFATAAGTIDDLQATLGKANAAWTAFKRVIGSVVGTVVVWIEKAGELQTKLLISAAHVIPAVIVSFKELVRVLGSLADIDLKALFTGDFKSAVAEVGVTIASAIANVGAAVARAEADIALAWDDAGKKSGGAFADGLEEGVAKAAAIAAGAASAAAAKKAEEDAKKAAAEEAKKAEQRKAIENAANVSILRSRIELAEEGSLEELEAQRAVMDELERIAIESAEKVGADKALIEKQFDIARRVLDEAYLEDRQDKREEAARRLAQTELEILQEEYYEPIAENERDRFEREREQIEDRLDNYRDMLELQMEADLENEDLTLAEQAAIQERYRMLRVNAEKDAENAIHALAMLRARQRYDMQKAIAFNAVALGRLIFGDNKAIAIAETVIRTAFGVIEALAMWHLYPLNLVNAGLMAAMGAAQIAKIASTEPAQVSGGSFDDPTNDEMARQMGRRSAVDLGTHFSSGFRDKARAIAMGGSRVSNVDRSSRTNISRRRDFHFHGPNIIDRVALQRFMQEARRAERQDRGRMQ